MLDSPQRGDSSTRSAVYCQVTNYTWPIKSAGFVQKPGNDTRHHAPVVGKAEWEQRGTLFHRRERATRWVAASLWSLQVFVATVHKMSPKSIARSFLLSPPWPLLLPPIPSPSHSHISISLLIMLKPPFHYTFPCSSNSCTITTHPWLAFEGISIPSSIALLKQLGGQTCSN